MNKKLILVALLPVLILTNNFYFPKLPTLTECEEPNSITGGCSQCDGGYGLYNGCCWPNCPSGFHALIPGYCVNQTIIQNHENFTLVNATNNVTYYQNYKLTDQCNAPNPNCTCMPDCPSNYISQGCTCVYSSTSASSQIAGNSPSTWMYIFAFIGVVSVAMAIGLVALKLWSKFYHTQKGTEMVQTTGYGKMVSESV